MVDTASVEVIGPVEGRFAEVITPEALEFIADLHRRFNPTRQERLAARARTPEALRRRREARLPARDQAQSATATGRWRRCPPTCRTAASRSPARPNRRMVINALNSGAKVFMADFEDANTPTWDNLVDGHVNLIDAIRPHDHLDDAGGPRLQAQRRDGDAAGAPARLAPGREARAGRRRADVGAACSTSACTSSTTPRRCSPAASAPYFYLPKMESHLEARLWNDVFTLSEGALGVPHGSIKATVLIETILGAFEIEEILYELRDHSAGCNAGRWDYIFSVMKKFRNWRHAAARPRPDHHDGALHARLHGAAGEDLPQARRPRNRRHGGVHPVAPRRRRQRRRHGARQGGQAARGQRRLRRHLGGAPGPRRHRHRGLRRLPGRAAEPARASSAPRSTSTPTTC